jgi:hypothetical protein
MVVMNTAKTDKQVEFEKYGERTNGFTHYKNVLTQQEASMKGFSLGSYKTVVLELKN